jgi:hypothetical protein
MMIALLAGGAIFWAGKLFFKVEIDLYNSFFSRPWWDEFYQIICSLPPVSIPDTCFCSI